MASTRADLHGLADGRRSHGRDRPQRRPLRRQADSRVYRLTVHDLGQTARVAVGDTVLTRYDDPAAYAAATTGWYRDPARAGVTDIKLPALATEGSATVTLTR